jgi:hypothetical protein
VNVQSHVNGDFAAQLSAAALWYARQGWQVVPLEVGGKRPSRAALNGYKSATSDAERIRAIWREPYNVGIPTGAPGPDVLDVDQRPGRSGWAAFDRLKSAGLLTGAHRLVRTRAGGCHLYFAGTRQGCGSLKAEGIDFKSSGGYVVAPPSFVDAAHTDYGIAGAYELLDDRPPTGATFDWAACKRLLVPPRPRYVGARNRGPGSAAHLADWLEQQGEGNRNNSLYWAVCAALEAGDEDIIAELAAVAISAGLSNDEVHKTVASAYRKVASNGGGA